MNNLIVGWQTSSKPPGRKDTTKLPMKPRIVRAHLLQLPERQQRQNCERNRLKYVKPEPAIRASLPDQLACSIVRPDEYEEGQISRNVDRYHRQNGIV